MTVQFPLFPQVSPLDPAPLEIDARVPLVPRAIDRTPATSEPNDMPRQLPLFSEWTGLSGALEQALADADFAAAREICSQIGTTYGQESVPDWAASLDEIRCDALWDRGDLHESLAAWRLVDAQHTSVPQRRTFRRAFFRRLFAVHAPEHVVAGDATALPLVANALVEIGETARARLLVRDALLAGGDVPDIAEDQLVADLLSEDLGPRWLASLGAIRRLWPLPLPDLAERATICATLESAVPADDADRACSFWKVLRLAECRSALPEPCLHAARRRLKCLHPDLHAAYVNRAGPFA